jgi:predicted class III extradiol MEMO1 family dioxygenase
MADKYGKIFAPYFDDPETLFIFSSDFCHWGTRFKFDYHKKVRWVDLAKHRKVRWLRNDSNSKSQLQIILKIHKFKQKYNMWQTSYIYFLENNLTFKNKKTLKTKFVKYAQSSQVKDPSKVQLAMPLDHLYLMIYEYKNIINFHLKLFSNIFSYILYMYLFI